MWWSGGAMRTTPEQTLLPAQQRCNEGAGGQDRVQHLLSQLPEPPVAIESAPWSYDVLGLRGQD